MATLSSARELAASSIQRAQRRYKEQYDRNARVTDLRVGEWVFVRFPQDETGRLRKLSRPWHGPYRILQKRDPDITVVKVYHPQHGEICVHQSRVCKCPDNFPAGYFWYGGKRSGPGRPPKWVEKFLTSGHQPGLVSPLSIGEVAPEENIADVLTAQQPNHLGQPATVESLDMCGDAENDAPLTGKTTNSTAEEHSESASACQDNMGTLGKDSFTPKQAMVEEKCLDEKAESLPAVTRQHLRKTTTQFTTPTGCLSTDVEPTSCLDAEGLNLPECNSTGSDAEETSQPVHPEPSSTPQSTSAAGVGTHNCKEDLARRESSDANTTVQDIKGPPEMKRCLRKAIKPPERLM